MRVRFPDGAERTPTDCRATHRLEYLGMQHDDLPTWSNDHFHARPNKSTRGPGMVIELPDQRQIVACLDFLGDGQGYAGGAWVDGHATAFVARKTGAAVVLELWDVEASQPGPWAISGLDGA